MTSSIDLDELDDKYKILYLSKLFSIWLGLFSSALIFYFHHSVLISVLQLINPVDAGKWYATL